MNTLCLLALFVTWVPQETPGMPPGARDTLPISANPGAAPVDYAAGKRLQTQLRSPLKSVRLQALRTFSRNVSFYQVAAVRPFALLEDPDPEIRAVALSVARRMIILPDDTGGMPHRFLGSRFAEAQIFALEHLPPENKLTPSDKAKIATLLNSPKPEVRVAVLRYAPLRKALVQPRLRDSNAAVRRQAAQSLSRFAPPNTAAELSALLKRATSIKAGERLNAARVLGKIAEPEATLNPAIVQALLPLTRDSNSVIRNEAVTTLSNPNAESAEIAQAMAPRLRDDNSAVRSVAARYFLTHKGEFAFAIPELLALAVRSTKFTVTMDPADDTAELLAARDARGMAFAVLGQIGADNAQVRETLLGLLKETAQDGFAFDALTQISAKHPELVNPLLKNLADTGRPDQQLAGLMVAQRNNAETLGTLTGFWNTRPAALRRATVDALEPSIATDIVLAPGNPAPTIVEIKPTLARDWVKGLLKDKDPEVRLSAARIISRILTWNDDVLNVLFALRDDPDPQVRGNVAPLLQSALGVLVEPTSPITLFSKATPAQNQAILKMVNAFLDRLDLLPQAEKAQLRGADELVVRIRKQIRELNSMSNRKVPSNESQGEVAP